MLLLPTEWREREGFPNKKQKQSPTNEANQDHTSQTLQERERIIEPVQKYHDRKTLDYLSLPRASRFFVPFR
jgi:hypothetical protein